MNLSDISLPGEITVGTEVLSRAEAKDLVRMVIDDARQFAGQFHNMERSTRFRANWPNEYLFAESEWRNFVEAVLLLYTQGMRDSKRPDYERRRMYLASVLWHMVHASAPESYGGQQIAPGSQAFEGDRRENARNMEAFGKQADSFIDLALPGRRFS